MPQPRVYGTAEGALCAPRPPVTAVFLNLNVSPCRSRPAGVVLTSALTRPFLLGLPAALPPDPTD